MARPQRSQTTTSVAPINDMATQQQNGGGTAPAPQQNRKPDPDPVDTGIPSPLGKGNIIDLGNRFAVPGLTPRGEVLKRINGHLLNAAEVVAVVTAKKFNLEPPRLPMYKRAAQKRPGEDFFRNDGELYVAPVTFNEEGYLMPVFKERGEGENNGQGQRSNSPATDTGVKCHLGQIKLSGDGRKYLVGNLAVYVEKRGTVLSSQQVGQAIDATKEGVDNGLPLNELLPKLPVVDFTSGRGEKYQKALTIDLNNGTTELHDLPGQDRRQGSYQRGGNDRGNRGGYDRGGARQDRGGYQQARGHANDVGLGDDAGSRGYATNTGIDDMGAGDFEQGPGGEETDGENFGEEQHHEAPAQAHALRPNRGFRR